MPEDFLAGIQQEDIEGDDAIAQVLEAAKDESTEKDTPSESPTDKTTTGKVPSPDGTQDDAKEESAPSNSQDENNVPFHKHPRWKAMHDKNRALEETLAMTAAEVQELRAFREQTASRLDQVDRITRGEEKVTIPKWFGVAFGEENTELYQEYQQHQTEMRQQIKAEIVQEQQQAHQAATHAAQSETARWDAWVTKSVDGLRDEGLEFDENELRAVALKYLPSDDRGNIDFRKAYDILQIEKVKDMKPTEKAKARKAIAAATTTKGSSESPPKEYMTAADLRRTSWNKLAEQ